MRRASPALVIAVLALVLACSGGAVAASSYITGKQVKNSSLTGADIRDDSLTPADFKGSVKGDPGPVGATGPTGAPGPAGPIGPAGPSAVAQLTRVTNAGVVGPGVVSGVSVSCPAGQGIVSGGDITAGAGVVFASDSFGARGWSVGYDNYFSSVSADVTAVAYCAPAGQAVTPRSAGHDAFAAAVATQRATH